MERPVFSKFNSYAHRATTFLINDRRRGTIYLQPSMFHLTYLDAFLGTVALYCVYRLTTSGKNASPLPPGPPKLPIIGNLFDMPTEKEWLTFAQWGEKYGMIPRVSCY